MESAKAQAQTQIEEYAHQLTSMKANQQNIVDAAVADIKLELVAERQRCLDMEMTAATRSVNPRRSGVDQSDKAAELFAKEKEGTSLHKLTIAHEKEVRQLKRLARAAQGERDAATANEAALRQDIERLSQKLLEDQRLTSQGNQLAQNLMTAQAEKIQSLETGNATLQADLDQMRTELSTHEQSQAQSQEASQRQQQMLREQELKSATAQRESLAQKNLALVQSQKELLAGTEQANSQLAQAKRELAAQTKTLETDRHTIAQQEAALEAAAQEIQSLKGADEKQRTQWVAQLQSAHEDEMSRSQKVKQIEAALADAQVDRQAAAEERTRLQSEAQAQRTRAESLSSQIEELQRVQGESEAQQTELHGTIQELTHQVEVAKKEARDKEHEVQLSEKKLEALKQKLASMPNPAEVLRKQQAEEREKAASMYGDEAKMFMSGKKGKRRK